MHVKNLLPEELPFVCGLFGPQPERPGVRSQIWGPSRAWGHFPPMLELMTFPLSAVTHT